MINQNTLNQKFEVVKFFYHSIIKEYESMFITKKNENYSIKATKGNWFEQVPLIIYNSEAFFFEVKSFLDIFIKFMTKTEKIYSKKFCSNVYFNSKFLNKIKPLDENIKKLIDYWENGLNNNHSLKLFNQYRNVVCHSDYLYVKYIFKSDYRNKEFHEFVLPDNPENDKEKFTTTKNINLIPLCKDVFQMIEKMLNDFSNNQINYEFNSSD